MAESSASSPRTQYVWARPGGHARRSTVSSWGLRLPVSIICAVFDKEGLLHQRAHTLVYSLPFSGVQGLLADSHLAAELDNRCKSLRLTKGRLARLRGALTLSQGRFLVRGRPGIKVLFLRPRGSIFGEQVIVFTLPAAQGGGQFLSRFQDLPQHAAQL